MNLGWESLSPYLLFFSEALTTRFLLLRCGLVQCRSTADTIQSVGLARLMVAKPFRSARCPWAGRPCWRCFRASEVCLLEEGLWNRSWEVVTASFPSSSERPPPELSCWRECKLQMIKLVVEFTVSSLFFIRPHRSTNQILWFFFIFLFCLQMKHNWDLLWCAYVSPWRSLTSFFAPVPRYCNGRALPTSHRIVSRCLLCAKRRFGSCDFRVSPRLDFVMVRLWYADMVELRR